MFFATKIATLFPIPEISFLTLDQGYGGGGGVDRRLPGAVVIEIVPEK